MTAGALFSLDGVDVLLTGAAGGIGRAVAQRAAAAGARVFAADLDGEAARAVAGDLGPAHAGFALDVASERSIEALLSGLPRTPSALIHCAGIGVEAAFLETSRETFEDVLRVNLLGTFLIAKAAAAIMSPGGSIVTFASTAGEAGSMLRGAYGASKAGVIALTKTMAAELASRGLRANVVSPGPVLTPLVERMHGEETRRSFTARVPMGRYAAPEEIADAALFLASDAARFVTGHVLTVDGGFTAVPVVIGRR